jgi:hypothetical protein
MSADINSPLPRPQGEAGPPPDPALRTPPGTLASSTRLVRPELANLLKSLKPGQRIRITQTVRVGSSARWPAVVEGAFRAVKFLATGLATDRVPEDDIVVVSVHFTKDNGELSSITLDEHSQVQAL